MKKITLLLTVAAACFLISGLTAAEAAKETNDSGEKTVKPILIRHGFLYSAEVSKLKPNFQYEVKGDQPPFPDPAWAAVMLKLPRNRGVSRFDYELKTPSGSYPCLAVALGAEPYSQKRDRWTIEAKKDQEGKFVRMLFAFPSGDLSQDPLQDFELVFKMRDSVCQPPPIPFRILPDDQALSANPQILGENGNCGLTWLEMHPELLPSLDDNPSEESEKKEEKPAGKAGEKKSAKPAAEAKSSEKASGKADEKKPAAEAKASGKEKADEKKPAAEAKSSEKASGKADEKKPAAETKSSKKKGKADEKKSAAEADDSEKSAGKADEKKSETKSSKKPAGKTGKASKKKAN